MIRVVKEMLVMAIDRADRDEVNRGYRTNFKAERRNIIDTLKNGAARVWADGFGDTSNLDMTQLEHVCANAYTTHMTEANYRNLHGNRGLARFPRRGGRDDLEILFEVGGYGINAKDDGTSQFTKHQQTIATIQTGMYKYIQDNLPYPSTTRREGHGSQAESEGGHGTGGSSRKGHTGAGAFKRQATRSRGGSQRSINMGSLHQGNLQGEQTTIAGVGGLEKMKEGDADMEQQMYDKIAGEFESKMDRLAGVDLNRNFDRIHEHMTNAFAAHLNLERTQYMTVDQMRNEIVVQTELNPMHRNPDMADYDKGQLKQFINNYDRSLIESLSLDLADEDLEGSRSPKQHMTAAVPALMIMKMFKHKSRPDMRLSVNRKLASEFKKKTKKQNRAKVSGKKKGRTTRKITAAARAGAAARGTKKGRSISSAATSQSPIALRNLLNEVLPQQVAQKMNAPYLRFRTGRFANSVRVDSLIQGPRGGTYIDYTYMKNPYQTFEPGFKQGSAQRDPRKIIGESIRELAIGILGRQPTQIRRL